MTNQEFEHELEQADLVRWVRSHALAILLVLTVGLVLYAL